MSNHLAIATATAALRHLVGASVEAAVSGADVTTLRPDASGTGIPATRVNIFLYQVTPNPDRRNDDLPSRRSDGTAVQRPVAALDLHYLFTFFGDDGQLEPQRLLAAVVRRIHAQPLLTAETIRGAIAAGPGTFLNGSDLAEQSDPVRITPAVMTLEDLSKLWSVFFQTPYSLSLAYLCSPVLVESEISPQRALPVRAANIRAIAFRQPTIIDVVDSDGGEITSSSTIRIRGEQIGEEGMMVRIAGNEVAPATASDSEATVDLSTLPADSLQSGVQGVQLIYPVVMSPARTLPAGVESNSAPFVLRPTIVGITVGAVSGTGDQPRSATITFDIEPSVGRRQKGSLLLNEFDPAPGSPVRAYTFRIPNLDIDGAPERSSSVAVPVSGVAAGTYLMRLQIDGAESLLGVDADGIYDSPRETIA